MVLAALTLERQPELSERRGRRGHLVIRGRELPAPLLLTFGPPLGVEGEVVVVVVELDARASCSRLHVGGDLVVGVLTHRAPPLPPATARR